MAELEDMSPTVYPDGSVIGSLDASGNLPENPELLHRPHAFALMHGDDGAKVAYGQLLWRIEQLNSLYSSAHVIIQLTQGAIEGLNAKVPTIDTEDGEVMSSGINFNDNDTKYHQLDGYGDVYLYWKVDLDDDDRVTKCWVTVDGTTATVNIPEQPAYDNSAGQTAPHNRLTGLPDADDTTNHSADGAAGEGTYRVKLGSVNEDAQVTQDVSSDVHWSILVHIRAAEA